MANAFEGPWPSSDELARISPGAVRRPQVPSLRNPLQFVTIIAGKEPDIAKFSIHKDFACHHSPVLRAAFSSGFIEGQTQTYHLEDSIEEEVRLLVHWMYTQELDLKRTAGLLICGLEELTSLVRLWVLADKLLIPRLQNKVALQIHYNDQCHRVPLTGSSVNYIYKNTAPGCPLRRLVVDQVIGWATSFKWSFQSTRPNIWPKEFLFEFSLAYIKMSEDKITPSQARDMCNYLVREQ